MILARRSDPMADVAQHDAAAPPATEASITLPGAALVPVTRKVGLGHALNGTRVGGQSIVPDGWLAEATSERIGTGQPGRGYGYQWWTYDDGSYAARGIFGQGIFIDPKRRLVIVSNADWGGGATDRTASAAREAFYRSVQQALDDEAAGAGASAAAR